MPVEETETSFRVRIRQPGEFQEDSFRTIDIDEERGIKAVVGRLREDADHPTAVQSFIFSKEHEWTADKAEAWVREHGETPKSLLTVMLDMKADQLETPEDVQLDFQIISRKAQGKDLVLEGWASTDAIDREGEVIEIDTMDLEGFRTNPILLYQHNPDQPIGKVTHFRKEKDPHTGKTRLWVRAVVDGTNKLGQEVIRLIKSGILRAFSVGGKAQKRQKRNGVTWLRGMKLMELSIVSIPANPEALFRTSKDLGEYLNQVSEVAVAKSLAIGLARSESEAKFLAAMELAVQKGIQKDAITSQSKEDTNMPEEQNKDATATGGQEKQDPPAIPEELMKRIEAMEAKIAALEQAVAAATGSEATASGTVETEAAAHTPDEKEAPQPTLIEAGEKKSHIMGGPHVHKGMDVKKMKSEDRKALAKAAFQAGQ